jgi:branched-chain amino acid transport system ATP-binding protein
VSAGPIPTATREVREARTASSLEVRGVSQHFGSLKAVDDVTFDVTAGSRHAVIGPNGAGKSTLFALIAGTLAPTSGTVLLDGRDVTGLPEPTRVRLGLVRSFQHSSLFLRESVSENVALAVQRRLGTQWSMLRPARKRANVLEEVSGILNRLGLADRSGAPAGSLSHGERRQLEVAVALGTSPTMLLLDEPAAGMSAADTERFKEIVLGLPDHITVMLVEHDLDLVFGLADRVTVMHLGRHLLTGTPDEIRADEEVHAAYLGGGDATELFPEVS